MNIILCDPPETLLPESKFDIKSFLPNTIEDWIILISSLILTILFLVISYYGTKLPWYDNLEYISDDNAIAIGILWVVAVLVSYGSFYYLKNRDDRIYGHRRLSLLFLISNYLNILWALIFFQEENFEITLLILAVLFIYELFVFIFVYYIDVKAALLLLPLVFLYGYLLYSVIHLASINSIIL